jgi:hypothetical protein
VHRPVILPQNCRWGRTPSQGAKRARCQRGGKPRMCEFGASAALPIDRRWASLIRGDDDTRQSGVGAAILVK